MKSTKILYLIAVCIYPIFTWGQKTTVNNEWNNKYFIYLGIGGQGYLNGDKGVNQINDTFNPYYTLGVGAKFSPVWGVRLGAYGVRASIKNSTAILDGELAPIEDMSFKYKQGYLGIKAEAMIDFMPLFTGKNTNRWGLSLLAGPGVVFSKQDYYDAIEKSTLTKGNKTSLSGSLGIQAAYNISYWCALDLEVGATGTSSLFKSYSDRKFDFIPHAMIGCTFTIGRKKKHSVQQPAINSDMHSKLQTLEEEKKRQLADKDAEIAQLRKDLAAQSDANAQSHNIKPDTASFNGGIKFFIGFKLNNSVVSEEQLVPLLSIGNYLRTNTSAKAIITGYADKDTGTSVINERLSEARAEAVANIIRQYGVNESSISVSHEGDRVQPFPNGSAYNRLTIIEVIDEYDKINSSKLLKQPQLGNPTDLKLKWDKR